MSKYTPQERREIYLKAAEFLFDFNALCCFAISEVTDDDTVYSDKSDFPELELFNPNTDSEFWFKDENRQSDRIFCLLLCAEMCNDNHTKP